MQRITYYDDQYNESITLMEHVKDNLNQKLKSKIIAFNNIELPLQLTIPVDQFKQQYRANYFFKTLYSVECLKNDIFLLIGLDLDVDNTGVAIERYNRLYGLNFSLGLTTRKFISKVYNHITSLKLDIDFVKKSQINTAYNDYMAVSKATKLNETIYIDDSIESFLFMGDGINDQWRTCQAVDGCYRAGITGLLADEVTHVISGGLGSGESGQGHKWRMLMHINNDAICFNRFYGFDNNGLRDEVIKTVLNYMKETRGVDYKHHGQHWTDFFRPSPAYKGYIDLGDSSRSSCGETYYTWNATQNARHAIGTKSICLTCGESTTSIREDALHCEDCVSSQCCEWCDDTLRGERVITSNDNSICYSCYQNYYFTCAECGEIHHEDDCFNTNNNDCVCRYCIDLYYYFCENCNCYFRDGIETPDGSCYCDDCVTEL